MTARVREDTNVRIEIGECRLDSDIDIDLASAAASLSGEEKVRAAGFMFPRDRDRYVRGRGYLRRRLGAFLGLAAEAVPIAQTEQGKPFVERSGVRFNLSHSGSRVVVAVSHDAELGIDLERIDRWDRLDDQLDGLAQMCLTASEQSALADVPRSRRTRRFLSFWTAKEARMKLTGEGLGLDPTAIALKLEDGRPAGYQRPLFPTAELRFVRLSRPGDICCVAVARPRLAWS